MDQIYGGGVNVVVPAGSTITDVIGKDEDYDFDLSIKSKEIPALADFALKIGGDAPMEGQLDENNQITFADGSTLTYYPEAEGQDERFVLTLGQDIHRSERVSLTYTARLAERDTSRGEHYVYPNVEAYLTLSDTGESYLFPRPRLGYTISGGGSGGGGGDTVIDENDTPLGPLPELNMADHFAYIIGRDDGLVHPEAQHHPGRGGHHFLPYAHRGLQGSALDHYKPLLRRGGGGLVQQRRLHADHLGGHHGQAGERL